MNPSSGFCHECGHGETVHGITVEDDGKVVSVCLMRECRCRGFKKFVSVIKSVEEV